MSQFCISFYYSKRKEPLITISPETYLTSRLRMKIIIGIQSQPILTAHPEHTTFLCYSIFHSCTAQLMKKWTQIIAAEQHLLSQTHKNPPGKQRLLFFSLKLFIKTGKFTVLGRQKHSYAKISSRLTGRHI